jgi:hypothetical protein
MSDPASSTWQTCLSKRVSHALYKDQPDLVQQAIDAFLSTPVT